MNCCPGDLAVQVDCPFARSNVGAMYHILQRCDCHASAWVVAPMQEVFENVGLLNCIAHLCQPGETCCAWDRELRPIRPGTTKEKTEEKEKQDA